MDGLKLRTRIQEGHCIFFFFHLGDVARTRVSANVVDLYIRKGLKLSNRQLF
jgi:hypothetical protein